MIFGKGPDQLASEFARAIGATLYADQEEYQGAIHQAVAMTMAG